MQAMGIYIHIPFCESKCPYCDFYSTEPTVTAVNDYTTALLRALTNLPDGLWGRAVDSVYFGGGTPPLLGADNLCAILTGLRRASQLSPNTEITIEANPNSITGEQLAMLHGAGVNRLSLGLQSAAPDELLALGRRHTPQQVERAVKLAREVGFKNISLDLMLGIPHQTDDSALKSLEFCAGLGVEHLSAYLLKIEPETSFGRQGVEGVADGDEMAERYLAVCRHAEHLGYPQYEISNFSKPEYESRHNLKYWTGVEYLGLGAAAHSFVGGKRRYFPGNLFEFSQAGNPFELWQDDGEGGDAEECLLLGLRLSCGVDLREFARLFPDTNIVASIEKNLPSLQKAGLMRRDGTHIALTPEGFLVSNEILAKIL